MSERNHQLIREFFAVLERGDSLDNLTTPDMSAWTATSGAMEKARFQAGVSLLASIFGGTLRYQIDSLTAEDDRVVAEVQSHGTLINGEAFHNVHVFVFRVRNGRIASVAEHMNQFIVRDKIAPLLQAAMVKKQS